MIQLVHCKKIYLQKILKERKIVCYGAGKRFEEFLQYWISDDMLDNIQCVIDTKKDGQSIQYYGKKIPIYNIEHFIEENKISNYIVVITNIFDCMNIVEELDQHQEFDGKQCYIEYIIDEEYPTQKFDYFTDGVYKIDKKIHYCWFGKKQIPEKLQRCIDSWKQYCPDYEIIRWDESNYDIKKNQYMYDAYRAQKWGFVPDFARLDIIYHYGGIYLDTDVELVRSLDNLRYNQMYCGFEGNRYIGFGIGFGAVKGHRIIKKLLQQYDNLTFDNENNNPVPSGVYLTESLRKEKVVINNTFQQMSDFTVYPSEMFSPISTYGSIVGSGVTENTFSIHHYDASWVGNRVERQKKKEKNAIKYFHRAVSV